MFTTEFADTDAWWQLKTGEYIAHHRKLPVPDPFSFTAYLGKAAYPGEENIRYFNLTHSWLSQVVFYAFYAAAGFPGVILFRACVLAGFCAVVGWIAWRRSQSSRRVPRRGISRRRYCGALQFRPSVCDHVSAARRDDPDSRGAAPPVDPAAHVPRLGQPARRLLHRLGAPRDILHRLADSPGALGGADGPCGSPVSPPSSSAA